MTDVKQRLQRAIDVSQGDWQELLRDALRWIEFQDEVVDLCLKLNDSSSEFALAAQQATLQFTQQARPLVSQMRAMTEAMKRGDI